MARTSIADLLALLGGAGLGDSEPEARERFARFLRQDKWTPDDLRAWVDECLELASRAHPEYYFALQDITTSVGIHLGFEVEFGSYSSAGMEIPYDGRWRALSGEDILIEVKSAPWPMVSAAQLGQYMHEYCLATGLSPRQVFGLYIIGQGDVGPLVDQIRGGDFRSRMKVITVDDLLRLFSLRKLLEKQMRLERVFDVIQNLLLPFDTVHVGNVIDIIEAVAGSALPAEEPRSPVAATTHEDWCRSEVRQFLEQCQPIQIALLLALCSSPRCELPPEQVLPRMRALAPLIPGLEKVARFTARTIGGARSGLSKCEQQIGKVSLIEFRRGQYSIREEYREWIADWLKERGYLPLKLDLGAVLDQPFSAAKTKAAG